MLKVDKVRKKQATFFYIVDYLWSGFATLGVTAVFIALWQWGSNSLGDFLLPPPLSVFERSLELLSGFTANQLDISLQRAIVGVGSSLLLGLTTGLIAGYFKTSMAILKPLITVMALFWFGFGDASVLFTIIIIVTPLTFAGAAVGISTINKQSEELFDAYKLGRWKKIRYLYIPHLTGYVISGISIAVASGMRVVVMAELLGANNGVGAQIADARTMLDTGTVMAYVILVIVLVSLFEYLIIKPLEILFMPWKH